MTVVFDTNVLVAALVFPAGRAAEALKRIVDGQDELLLSKPILDELLSVLGRKFARDREELARLAVWLADAAAWVRPDVRLAAVRDEPDNRILECAVSGNADAIVTGDHELLSLARFRGIELMNLRTYLDRP